MKTGRQVFTRRSHVRATPGEGSEGASGDERPATDSDARSRSRLLDSASRERAASLLRAASALGSKVPVERLKDAAAQGMERLTTENLQKAAALTLVPTMLFPVAAAPATVEGWSGRFHHAELFDLFSGCMTDEQLALVQPLPPRIDPADATFHSQRLASSAPLGELCDVRIQIETHALASHHLGRPATPAEQDGGRRFLECAIDFDAAVDHQQARFIDARQRWTVKLLTDTYQAQVGRAPSGEELKGWTEQMPPAPARVDDFMPKVVTQLQTTEEWRKHLVLTQLSRFAGHPLSLDFPDAQALLAQANALAEQKVPPAELAQQVAAGAEARMRFPLQPGELAASMPKLSSGQVEAYFSPLREAMLEFGITSVERIEAFLAQVSHESAGLTRLDEYADGSAYEGREDLGNIHPGDGVRYKGRGAIMLTGRANYRNVGRILGLDLEDNPELAARPDVSFRIAGLYWSTRGLNELADRGDFNEITKRINGGYNGLEDRHNRWAHIRDVVS